MSEWKPIETAPRDGTSLLIHGQGFTAIGSWSQYVIDGKDRGDWAVMYDYDCEWDKKPTHWQPIPEPPR